MKTIAMTEARWKLRDLVDHACAGGEAVLVKRNGKYVVAIISYDEYLAVEGALAALRQEGPAASR